MQRTCAVLLVICCITLIPAYWKQDRFPVSRPASADLLAEPRQHAVDDAPFAVNINAVDYLIRPLFSYSLTGLVVSHRAHDADYGLHRLWDDHLNVADVCVVWGNNASRLNLNDYQFRSGQFTCFVEAADRATWNRFDPHQLSNNHLITADESLRDAIHNVRVGDEVTLSGWLATYATADGYHRGTSTSRTDSGNGACETIYVRQFMIVDSPGNPWRTAYRIAGWGAICCALGWLFFVARGASAPVTRRS